MKWKSFVAQLVTVTKWFHLNLMHPVPGPGAVHSTWTSVLGTADVWVIPLGQTSLKRLSESLKRRKLPAVSGEVGMEGLDGLAVNKKPINFWRTFGARHPCRVTRKDETKDNSTNWTTSRPSFKRKLGKASHSERTPPCLSSYPYACSFNKIITNEQKKKKNPWLD